MNCSKCGQVNEVGKKFCTTCGNQLQKKLCPECEADLSPVDKFCGECGIPVSSRKSQVAKPQIEESKEKFVFVPHPSNDVSEETSEKYKVWLDNSLLSVFKAKGVPYKSPEDFKPGNYLSQLMTVLDACTYIVVPVCVAICTHFNISLLTRHFSVKDPIVLLLPKEIAGEMSPFQVGLGHYKSYSCKTDPDIERTVLKVEAFIHNKDSSILNQQTTVAEEQKIKPTDNSPHSKSAPDMSLASETENPMQNPGCAYQTSEQHPASQLQTGYPGGQHQTAMGYPGSEHQNVIHHVVSEPQNTDSNVGSGPVLCYEKLRGSLPAVRLGLNEKSLKTSPVVLRRSDNGLLPIERRPTSFSLSQYSEPQKGSDEIVPKLENAWDDASSTAATETGDHSDIFENQSCMESLSMSSKTESTVTASRYTCEVPLERPKTAVDRQAQKDTVAPSRHTSEVPLERPRTAVDMQARKSTVEPSQHTCKVLLERPRTAVDLPELGNYKEMSITTASTDNTAQTLETPMRLPEQIRASGYVRLPIRRNCELFVHRSEDEDNAIPIDTGKSRGYEELMNAIYNGKAVDIQRELGSMATSTIIRYVLLNIFGLSNSKGIVCLAFIARYTEHEDVQLCSLKYLTRALRKIKHLNDSYIADVKLLQETITPSCSDVTLAWGKQMKEEAAILVIKASRMIAMVLLIDAVSQKDTTDLDSLVGNTDNCLKIVAFWKERGILGRSNIEATIEEITLTSIFEDSKFVRSLEPAQRDVFLHLNMKLLNFTGEKTKDFSFLHKAKPAVKVALMCTVSALASIKSNQEMFKLQNHLYTEFLKKDKSLQWNDRIVLVECVVQQVEELKQGSIEKVQGMLNDTIDRCKKALLKRESRDKCEHILGAITHPLLFHSLPHVRENSARNVIPLLGKMNCFIERGITMIEAYSKKCIESDLILHRVSVKNRTKDVSSRDGRHTSTVFTGRFGNYKEGVEIHCLIPKTLEETQNSHLQADGFKKVKEVLGRLQSAEENFVKMLAYMWPGNGISYYFLHVGIKHQTLSSYIIEKVDCEHPSPVSLGHKRTFALSMISAVRYCSKEGILIRNITLGSFITCLDQKRRVVKLYNLDMAEIDDTKSGITGEKTELLPLLWLAPESIFKGKYHQESESFSLAFALMELYSDGIHPYQEMGQAPAKEKIKTILKYKLLPERRPGVPEEVYLGLLMCLFPDPTKRQNLDGLHSYFKDMSEPKNVASESQDIRRKEWLRTQSKEPEMIFAELVNLDTKAIAIELLGNEINTGIQPRDCINKGIPEHLQGFQSWEEMWMEVDNTDLNFLAGQFSVKDEEFDVHDRPYKMSNGQMQMCVTKRRFPQTEINLLKTVCRASEENHFVASILKIGKSERSFCPQEHPKLVTDLSFEDCETLLEFALKSWLKEDQKKHIYMSICRGVKYLHDNNLIHCSLQAKYIYMTTEDSGKIGLKIGQLNRLTQLHMDNNDTNMTEAIAKPFDQLPNDIRRWCPLETHDMGLMSMYSDVAQFGYTIWEVENATTKELDFPRKSLVPYAYLPVDKIPDAQRQGHDLPKPDGCKDWIYRLIKLCTSNPKFRRPLFDEIGQILTDRNPSTNPTLNINKRITYDPRKAMHAKPEKRRKVRSNGAKFLSVALDEESETVQKLKARSWHGISEAELNVKQVKKKNSKVPGFLKNWLGHRDSRKRSDTKGADMTSSTNRLDVSMEENLKDNNIYQSLVSVQPVNTIPSSDPNLSNSTAAISEWDHSDQQSSFSKDTFDDSEPDEDTRAEAFSGKVENVSNCDDTYEDPVEEPISVKLVKGLKEFGVVPERRVHHTDIARPTLTKTVETVGDLRKNFPLPKTTSSYAPIEFQPSVSHSFHMNSHMHAEEDEPVRV